ncbi:CusA/CzcA family heavy metal efflux RND transporter [Cytophagaceae bacterium DM2B3-1]|uniref:CusA/CzcA family heavy metal efflux RND transporter n=1 Tax=Xanthocytophaga flava TaxID=3048013 RepID=A0ABT7CUX4_9BACT|nr:CusA/CzcA family heavy metal efflux RND transporter [Xanthocytophaga flavus]MDJ1497569.1 CusA/CzcA family heavy metal efflux RND transporter [Xanthocytophaga flavus]
MLDKIIHFSIHNKLIIGLLTLVLIIWGGWSLTQLPIDAVPDITSNQVQIITRTPSLAAQEVERLITFPIEQTMATIPEILEIRSFSRFGLSVVTIVFQEQTDIYWARQQVFERLQQAKNDIPAGVGAPELGPVTTGLGEIYQYTIHPKKGYEKMYTPMELRTIQDWIIRRQLLGTEGVAEVSSFGGYLKQYEIALDPNLLNSYHLSINDVFTALEKNNQNTGGAYIDKKPNAYFIRSEGLIGDTTDIKKIVIKQNGNGIPVLIGNIGRVTYGHATRYGAMTYNDQGEVVGAIVMMLKGENSSKVINNVKTRIAQIQKTLPKGLVIDAYLDRTRLVNNAISTVEQNLLEGALIVIFVLVIMLGNLRAGLVVASVIPLAMLFAVSMMHLFGVSGNLMSLGAIDFGLIVDGAVIIVEATLHHIVQQKYSHRLSQEEMDREVYQAAIKIRSSAAFGEIIILIVYLPILTLTGIEGKMFRPMAQVVSFAILGAFILSLTYVPMVSALWLSKNSGHTKPTLADRLMKYLHRVYTPVLHFALSRKKLILGISVIALVASLFLFTTLGGEFIPTLEEGDFAVETRLVTGSSVSQTIETAQKAAAILLKKFPEIKEVVGKVGSSEVPTDPMPIESCDLMIILKDKSEWVSASNREELAQKMQEALSALPGVSFGFQQPIQMRFNELATGARQDVVLKIYGEDLNTLAEQARVLGKLIRKVQGAEDLYIEQITGLPQIVVNYNRDKIAEYGLAIEDINKVIRAGFAGESAGLVFEGERRFDLMVRLEQGKRQSIEDVTNLYISTPAGNQIPLSQVATVELKNGPNQIQRDNAQRRITVGFNVRNRDVQSIVQEIQDRIEREIKLPTGYYVTYGGTFENLLEARQRLSVAVPVALTLIFILLYFTFSSIMQSILIFTAIPLSAIGGILALWLRNMPFSISAGIGFIALFGVAVLNGIVLLGEFNRLKQNGLTNLQDIIFQGTETRLRPVLMTALVASLGFLPMALSQGAGGEVQKPLATVVIGGLVSSTLLTLLVLPVLYMLFEKSDNTKQNNLQNNTYDSSSEDKPDDESSSPIRKILAVNWPKSGVRLSVRFWPFVFVMFLISILVYQTGNAQTSPMSLSLEKAIELALQNNLEVQSGLYEIDAQKMLQRTASDIGKTNINWMGGQYNSVNFDNSFTITQNIPFPLLLSRRANYQEAQTQTVERRLAVTQNALVHQVKSTYELLVLAKARHRLYQEQDSIFSQFVRSAQVRYRTGESTFLEQSTAESQLQEIRLQLSQNESDILIAQSQLQTLLNQTQPITATDEALQKQTLSIQLADTNALLQNPTILYYHQQVITARQFTRVERALALPDFTIGYFNQSLIGTQVINGQDRFFNGSKRFQGIEAGISLPLWFRPFRARTQAASLNEKIAQTQVQYYQKAIGQQWQQAIQEYTKYLKSLEYYEKTALLTAKLILENAQKAYRAGEIGYLEYSQGLNRSLMIRMQYLETLHRFNQAVIQIEFLAGQK